MAVLFGLVSAIGWGTTYFIAQKPSRQIGTLRTILYFQIIGLLMLTTYVLLSGLWQVLLSVGIAVWIAMFISAMTNTMSVIADFRAIQVGVLSLVTPITANYAIITIIFALINGDSLTTTQWLGILLSTLGIVLVTARRYNLYGTDRQLLEGLAWALLAAFGYGFSYWVVGTYVTTALGGILPLWFMRINSVIWLSVIIHLRRRKANYPYDQRALWYALIAMAVMDNIGSIASFVGFATTNVSIVTIVASMYTVVTILLARIFYQERLIRQQWAGVMAIIGAIILVSL